MDHHTILVAGPSLWHTSRCALDTLEVLPPHSPTSDNRSSGVTRANGVGE